MTVITQLPDPPSRTTPSQFSTRTDAFLGALPGFVTETNAVAAEVNADKSTAVNSAAIAVTKAAEAASSAAMAISVAGLTRWTSGEIYTEGASVYSPINSQAYRRITSGAGTTDPSLDRDRVNWRLAIDDGITTLVLDKDREVQIYSNETNKQFSIMAPNRTPFLYSEDGIEWEMSDGLAKNLTGDAYVSGLKRLGVMSVVKAADTFWLGKSVGATFLNGYLYVGTIAVIYQYSFPNGVLINSVAKPFVGDLANLMSDGTNLIALSADNVSNNQATYAWGNLSSAPTMSTRVYPQRNVGRISGFYGGNLYQHFYSKSLSSQSPATTFNAVGTKYYMIHNYTYPTVTFNLSTPYDLTTAVVDRLASMEVATGIYAQRGNIKPDGLMFYEFGDNILYQYSMSTAFNFSAMTNTGKTLNLGTYSQDPIFHPSGTKIFYLNTGSGTIRQITLSTAWDLATAGAYVEMTGVFNQKPSRWVFAGNGLVAYVYVSLTQIGWHKVNLSVAWDITTATDAGLITSTVTFPTTNYEYKYSNDGTMIYVTVGGATVGYALSTPWAIETAGAVQTLIPTMAVMDTLVKYDGVSDTKLDASPLVDNVLSIYPLATSIASYSGCINGDGDIAVAAYTYGAVVFEYGSATNTMSYNWKYVEAVGAFDIPSTVAYNPVDDTIYACAYNLLASGQYTTVKFGGPSAVLISEELI